MAPPAAPALPSADRRSTDPSDPNGFEPAWTRLSGTSRRAGVGAALVTVAILGDDEQVERVLVGRFRGEAAVLVLTNVGLIIANERHWAPEIVVVTDIAAFAIEGWIDGRAAIIRLSQSGEEHVIDSIRDTELAAEMTAALRAR